MKPFFQTQASQTLSECCAALCRYQLQKEYDTTITLCDGQAKEPVCSHHAKGNVSFPLWKLLTAVGIVAAFCALLHGLCSLFSD